MYRQLVPRKRRECNQRFHLQVTDSRRPAFRMRGSPDFAEVAYQLFLCKLVALLHAGPTGAVSGRGFQWRLIPEQRWGVRRERGQVRSSNLITALSQRS